MNSDRTVHRGVNEVLVLVLSVPVSFGVVVDSSPGVVVVCSGVVVVSVGGHWLYWPISYGR